MDEWPHGQMDLWMTYVNNGWTNGGGMGKSPMIGAVRRLMVVITTFLKLMLLLLYEFDFKPSSIQATLQASKPHFAFDNCLF